MSTLSVNTIEEVTSANGVVVDGVTLKDGGAAFTGTVTGVPSSARLVFIKTETAPTATAWTIEDTFSSDYDAHLLVFSNVTIAAQGDITMQLQYRSDGSIDTGSNYYWDHGGVRAGGSHYAVGNSSGTSAFTVAQDMNAATKAYNGALWVNGVLSTSAVTTMHGTASWYHNSHAQIGVTVSYWFNSATNLYDGIKLSCGQNINGGRVTSYGLKHS